MHQLTAIILLSTSPVHSKVHHLVVAQPPVVISPRARSTLHLEITPGQAGRRSDRHTDWRAHTHTHTERERDRRSQVTPRDAEDVLRDASWRLRPPIPGCGRSWPLLLRVESLTDVVRERQTVSLARPPPAPLSSDPWRATPGHPGRARAVIEPTRLIRHPVCARHARAES